MTISSRGISKLRRTSERTASIEHSAEATDDSLLGNQTFGNNFHVSVVANDKAEADRVFAALSTGAVHMPLGNAPWGPYFGMCVDRFGINWMVSLPTPV
jgi:uncharacterized glyoxalase superfamily protein PhnB